jgi:hypothetical protein
MRSNGIADAKAVATQTTKNPKGLKPSGFFLFGKDHIA